ncbi:CHAD domain-containing protein [Kitasatospora purpeofusca]|uniref:CYTH and CHAD domain-containing protein n=1 Tax=Kitasatospora purpeofusca TaxID=67352 RepID=UPI0036B96F3B
MADTRTATETERKYEGAALPAALDRLPGVADSARAEPQELEAVYFDTPDLRLLRRRITLRRRAGGSDAGWHLKRPLGADARSEARLPLDGRGPREVPAEFAAGLAAFTRGAALVPVARLRTRRAEQRLRDEDGRVLARVTEDRVVAEPLAAAGTSDAPATVPPDAAPVAGGDNRPPGGGWTEFEIELERGAPDLLDHAEAAFTAAGLTRSAWPSKLAHALGRTDPPGAPDTAGGARTAGRVVLSGLRTQLDALLDLDGAVRRGEEDSVHRMRVTARRLRSLLKAHRRLFDRRRSSRLADELRWLGRLLGGARDQEVLADELLTALTDVPEPMRRGALRARITERFSRGYRHAWQRAVTELDRPRYFALLDDLEAFLARPPLRRRARRDAAPYLTGVLRREQRRTLRRLDLALDTDPGPGQDEALHSARKAAKRARYTAEGARPSLRPGSAKRAARFARRMKELHKLLGEQHDSVVVRRTLVALGEENGVDPRHAFAFGVLHEARRRADEDARSGLPRLRRRAAGRKLARLRRTGTD